MTAILDTNVLVRLAVVDDAAQAETARALMKRGAPVIIPITALCEFVWVLSSYYKRPRPDIAAAIRQLTRTADVIIDRATVDVALAIYEAGGDFADGAIAGDGRRLGGRRFVSFDREAVRAAKAMGFEAELLR